MPANNLCALFEACDQHIRDGVPELAFYVIGSVARSRVAESESSLTVERLVELSKVRALTPGDIAATLAGMARLRVMSERVDATVMALETLVVAS